MALFELAVSNKEGIFKQKDQEQIIEHLASIDNPLLGGREALLRVILYNYYNADPNNVRISFENLDIGRFSPEEVEKYVGRFVADTRHFLYCKEIMESLVESVISQNKTTRASLTLEELQKEGIISKRFRVVEKNDNENMRYEYIPTTFEDFRQLIYSIKQ